MKLTTKFVLFGLLFGIGLGTLTGGGAYFFIIDSAEKELVLEQQVRAEETMIKLDHFLYERYIEVQELANSFRFLIDDKELLLNESQEILLLTSVWNKIKVINLSAEILSSTNQDEIGTKIVSQEEQELYKKALSGEVAYSDVRYIDQFEGQMTWAVPIRSGLENKREIIGVMMFDLSEYVLESILENNWKKTENIYIVNSYGRIILFQHKKNHTEASHEYIIEPELWKKLKTHNQSLKLDYLFYQNDVLVNVIAESGYIDYQGNNWYLISQIPTKLVHNRTFNEILVIFTAIISVFTLLILGLIIFLNKVVTKPVMELTRVASDMTAGKINSRVQINTKDELGQMGTAFNTLMNKLEESQKNLEKKVEERTKRLTKTMSLMVNRELKMKHMKEEMKTMNKEKS